MFKQYKVKNREGNVKEVLVRPATTDDLRDALKLCRDEKRNSCFREWWFSFSDVDIADAILDTDERISYVAIVDGRLFGFASVDYSGHGGELIDKALVKNNFKIPDVKAGVLHDIFVSVCVADYNIDYLLLKAIDDELKNTDVEIVYAAIHPNDFDKSKLFDAAGFVLMNDKPIRKDGTIRSVYMKSVK